MLKRIVSIRKEGLFVTNQACHYTKQLNEKREDTKYLFMVSHVNEGVDLCT